MTKRPRAHTDAAAANVDPGRTAGRDPEVARLEGAFGAPARLSLEVGMTGWEFDLLRYSKRDGRYRDATILVPYEGGLVCIVKHGYPDGIARPPSGGVVPGEALDAAAEREAYEETGLRVRLKHYLLAVSCWFHIDERGAVPPARALAEASRPGRSDYVFDAISDFAAEHPAQRGAREYWESHVFWATPIGGRLEPRDTTEIKALEVVSADQLEAVIHPLMKKSGVGGFDYRVRLQEEAMGAARARGLLPSGPAPREGA